MFYRKYRIRKFELCSFFTYNLKRNYFLSIFFVAGKSSFPRVLMLTVSLIENHVHHKSCRKFIKVVYLLYFMICGSRNILLRFTFVFITTDNFIFNSDEFH